MRSRSRITFIQILAENIILRHFMRANLLLVSVTSGFYATNCVGLECVSFLDQLGHTFRIRASMLDNPCKSPDCPPLALCPSSANASVSTLWLLSRACVLRGAGVFALVVFLPWVFVVFTAAFFNAGFCFANFFFGVPLFLARFFLTVLFIGFLFFPADPFSVVRFLLVLFWPYGQSTPTGTCVPTNGDGNPQDALRIVITENDGSPR